MHGLRCLRPRENKMIALQRRHEPENLYAIAKVMFENRQEAEEWKNRFYKISQKNATDFR